MVGSFACGEAEQRFPLIPRGRALELEIDLYPIYQSTEYWLPYRYSCTETEFGNSCRERYC